MDRMSHHGTILAVILCTLLGLGSPLSGQQSTAAYRIGPKDLIEVQVFEVDDLKDLKLRVAEDGTIRLPIVGQIKVVGMTPSQAAAAIKKVLESRYVQQATVDVTVAEFRSRPISVLGAVKQPGPLPFAGPWTVLEALTAAGGISENHGNKVQILRRADNGLSDQLSIDLQALMGGDPALNVPLQANDLVNVPADVTITIYCLGEVNNPGAIDFRSSERVTLLAAIARAGGLSDRASKKIVVKRQANSGSPSQEINVDYKAILAGDKPDFQLQAGDVIVVKESFL